EIVFCYQTWCEEFAIFKRILVAIKRKHLTEEDVSLPEVHRSIPVPRSASFWRKMFAFSGPGFLVAVGYIDPGNWATNLQGGAQFGFTLLSVIMISNLMAILLQHL